MKISDTELPATGKNPFWFQPSMIGLSENLEWHHSAKNVSPKFSKYMVSCEITPKIQETNLFCRNITRYFTGNYV